MKILGLDIGSSSIGWSIREFNQTVKNGVITFNSGMLLGNNGKYSSPTRDRREDRLPRNLKRARKYRKWALLELLIQNEMVPLSIEELDKWRKYKKGEKRVFPETKAFKSWLACNFNYANGVKYKNPYELRVKGLDHKLSLHEFGRTLYHIVQRRGYKDIGEKDNETKKQIERREQTGFEGALNDNRTVGEALLKNYIQKDKRARNEYPYRHEYQNELELLCKGQGYDITKENNVYINPFVKKLHKAVIWQRPLKSQKGNIGFCTLEEKSRRCSISHPLFEIFRALSFINTIRIVEINKKVELTESVRKDLLMFFLKQSKNFKFEDVRKKIDRLTQKNNNYNYPINKKGIYYSSISNMPFCKNLIGIFGEEVVEPLLELCDFDSNAKESHYKLAGKYSIYDFWHFFNNFEDDFLIRFVSKKLDVEAKKIMPFKNSLPNGYSNLSLKALRKIIPFLSEGFLYHEAVLLAKLPEYIDLDINKSNVYECLRVAKEKYSSESLVIRITNMLIEDYKSLEHKDKFAFKDISYKLLDSDLEDVIRVCKKHFGENSWENLNNKQKLLATIKIEYQEFFEDKNRNYRRLQKLSEVFRNELTNSGLNIGELYHHSDFENKYGKCVEHIIEETGQVFELLPSAVIPSIKNPMFNKSMSILRKLINELILKELINEETKVLIEIPRGHIDDNNEREAYIRYTSERESIREKYRAFLLEYRDNKNSNLNIEEKISVFELWNEQILEKKENQLSPDEILKLNDATERYSLWMEQEAICMYTGKTISISQLFSNEIDIEHTIPRSILPDNTMANKTVCFKSYNTDIKNTSLPSECPNYDKHFGNFGRIDSRLEKWKEKRDHFKDLFDLRKKARGKEDENKKNKRVKEKHYYKLKFNYWKDKVERFEAKEVKEGWARRQLVDTQMVCKYTRELLKTKFQKVEVISATVNVAFRKMYGFQSSGEKNRDKHTHHIIDALLLSYLPVNGSKRLKLVRQMYKWIEDGKGQLRLNPPNLENFNPQKIISEIENNTLVVNYTKDTITKQTFKYVRKRGKIQYLKRKGKFMLDSNMKKIPLIAKGDTIRKSLFKDTFIGKIREVKRDESGRPLRDKNKKLIFNDGDNEFSWVVRKELKDVLSKTDKIVDPVIANIVKKQKHDSKDPQGNQIRRVRVKVKKGKEVKKRLNYKSKYEYKNQYYSSSGSIPYALFILEKDGNSIKKSLKPIHTFQIAKILKDYAKFEKELYIKEFMPDISSEKFETIIIKNTQRVLVLLSDEDYFLRKNKVFQKNRLYGIKQLEDTRIKLVYHLFSGEPKNYSSEFIEGNTNCFRKSITQLNLLFEGVDFKMSILGELTFIDD